MGTSLLKRMDLVFCLILISTLSGCGGGGGGDPDPGPKSTNVVISGKIDDGTANSPITNASCIFVDESGNQLTLSTSDGNGRYDMEVPPNVEGTIICKPPNLPNLSLYTLASTRGMTRGDRIEGEDVTPITTFVVQKVQSEQPSDPIARKRELLAAIASSQDGHLNLLVELSTRMYAEMFKNALNVNFGAGGEGGGNSEDGGGVGGDTGDGADFSPIPNANCEFVVGSTLGNDRSILFDTALADLADGRLDRPDLDKIKATINALCSGQETEIKQAFAALFPEGVGRAYRVAADDQGTYFLPVPPNVPGYVRCTPPDQEKLVLATYVPARQTGQTLAGEDVTPATTLFSANIASVLGGGLEATKDNYLSDIQGLEVQLEKTGETLTGFQLKPGTKPANEQVGLAAFSATALYNIFYKNKTNADYLAALQDLTTNRTKTVDEAFLNTQLGIPADQAAQMASAVNDSVAETGTALGTTLEDALSTARIRVTVSTDGQLVSNADVSIDTAGLPEGVQCNPCSGTTQGQNPVRLTLTGVPASPATEIAIIVRGIAGYEAINETTSVVAFATVDLEIPLLTDPGKTLTGLSIAGPSSATEGGTAQYTATAHWSDNTASDVTSSCSWSDNSSFSSISASGVLTTSNVQSDQPVTLTASYTYEDSTVTDTHALTIVNVDRLTGITINGPASVNEGGTTTFTASANWDNGATTTAAAVWSESSSYASISAAGVLTTSNVTANQALTITASFTHDGVTRTDTHAVTIVNVDVLTGLTINGPTSVNEGTSPTYTATASWDNNTTTTVTPTWSENSSYASISAAGVLTTSNVTANQVVTITASFTHGGVTRTDTHAVTIANATNVLTGLTINGPTSVNEGGTATCTATASWDNNTTTTVTPTWSENSSYASISAAGVLSASSVTANQTVTITASYTSGGRTFTDTHSVTIIDNTPSTGSINGTVVDASTARPISGARISIDGGAQSTTTSSEGRYNFSSVVLGSHQVTASMQGYTNSVRTLQITNQTPLLVDFALSRIISSSDTYRVVLRWGASPNDLDSHMWTPDGGHVYFGSRGSQTSSPYTLLDVDDTSSYGPETITIFQAQPGTYRYSVNNYSGGAASALSNSGATISLYNQSGLIREWNVPLGSGLWWNVFTLDGNSGQVTSLNTISN